ncbi:ABC transporter ATP-binding protein [Aeromicrobium sp. Leaf350]|uniref:ABC transporter ATP-binding protein n=1 Tax=Aeromicrobium sp. Leaf350 TaxID=2876565 RepID=UPI001E49EBB5|nr:ABC transporter ATP-binding protein [Aeromicrobium sp. Leaf350]
MSRADEGLLPRLPVADRAQMRAEVGRLASGRGWSIAGILALLLLSAASTLVLPLTIGWMVDTVTTSDGSGVPAVFWWQLGALATAAVVGGIVELFGVVALGRLVDTMAAELRERFVASSLDLPEAEVERVGVGDVVTRAATDTRAVADDLPGILPTMAWAGFTIVLVLAGTAVIDWRFTIAFALGLPLYVRALRWYLPAVPPVYAALRSSDSTRGEQVLTTLNALPTVAAFQTGPARVAGVQAATWEVARWEVRARIMQNRFFGRINLAEAVGLLLVLGCGFVLADRFGTTLGQVTAASLLFLQVTGPLQALMFVMDDLQSAAASFARVVGVTSSGSTATTPASASAPATRAVVEVDGVGFAYRSGHPVLQDVSFSVAPGEHVAVVGSTGSGKTTLARLVAGVREPTSGSIATGVDRSRIAYLDQASHVFAGTLRDNLRFAAPEASDATLHDALRTARADGVLAALPEGLDSALGDEGHRITGADAQLLSLARLVLHDPDLAILDEATAEADSRTAGHLAAATAQVLAGRTAIVIAHRLSQAKACDRVVVLEQGRVLEEGSHDDLLAAGGRYAELWRVYSGT